MKDVGYTRKRMADFFRLSTCSVRKKIIVDNAMIKAKLRYGLESQHPIDSATKRMDAFQQRGLR